MINKRLFKVIDTDQYILNSTTDVNDEYSYFTTCDHIHKFIHQGVNVVEIFLSVNFGGEHKIGKTYSLFDISTYSEIQLDMNNHDVVNEIAVFASFHNKIHILEWLMENCDLTNCDERSVDTASCLGNIQVLDWWKTSGLDFKYSCRSLDLASRNNKVDVLNWWLNSGYTLSYSANSVNTASMNGHLDTLNWWLYSKLQLVYNEFAFDFVIFNNDTETAEWWLKSGLVIKFTTYAIRINQYSDVVKLLNSNLNDINYICYDYGF